MSPYWTTEVYGFGKWIRKFGFYPAQLPLCIFCGHGVGYQDIPFEHELNSDAPVQFYHSHVTVDLFRKMNSKPCYVMSSPFVFARRKLKIEQNPMAKGTLYFVAHSTDVIDDHKSLQEYHQEIMAIPDKFQPVTLCLHIHDVNKGLDKLYEALGHKVVTAGDALNPNFTENFYRILCNYQYSMSNFFGSYAYYSVEMGIPFGLYGSEPILYNKGDTNIEKGFYRSYKNFDTYEKSLKLFGGFPADITPEQKKYVEQRLGLYHGISRIKMAYVLYRSLILWTLRNDKSGEVFRLALSIIRNKIGLLGRVIFQRV